MARTVSDSQILAAALDVIAERGYVGATTRQISEAAGINEVTLFRRFGSKEKLLKAAVEQEADYFIASGIEYTGDIEADLLRIVQFYRSLVQSRGRVLAMLLSEIPRQPDLLEVLQTPLAIIEKITGLLQRYQDEGVLVQEAPMNAFIALVGPLFMGGVVGFVEPNIFTVSYEPAEQVRRYLQGRTVR